MSVQTDCHNFITENTLGGLGSGRYGPSEFCIVLTILRQMPACRLVAFDTEASPFDLVTFGMKRRKVPQ
jgi:hypothetical protein